MNPLTADEYRILSRHRLQLMCATATALLTACGDTTPGNADISAAELRSAAAMQARPSSVPNDYVRTPFGYLHQSCVLDINDTELVRDDQVIENDDGTARAYAACAHPRFDLHGNLLAGDSAAGTPPQVNGWIESAGVVTTALGHLQAAVVVPRAPLTTSGQTLFYFPGIEPAATGDTILQPVMTYDNSGWYVRSWNCCKYGNSFASPPLTIKTGDSLLGTMTGSHCNTTSGACANWTVAFTDEATGKSTRLNTNVGGEVMDWTFGGVLEAYAVNSCDELPENGVVTFTGISARTPGGTRVSLPWQTHVDSSASPLCSYGVATTSTSVTLDNLRGVTILRSTPHTANVKAGGSVQITFKGQGGPTQVAEKVFVHVYGPARYGFDFWPVTPTTAWVGSGTHSETRKLTIPSNAPKGSYAIDVGLFDPNTGARVPLYMGPGVTTGNDGQDAYRVGGLTVL